MFGSKFKTWMENHIVRPKRKTQHDREKGQTGGKGPILESSESLAHSDTGISSGSQQVLSSSNTDNNEGYCTTTMESNRSGGMAHCHTAVNLSSPESAYSTGYSTDGTSPGGTGPPEYYINIRTGKHYFPSPAPTPTSPQPSTAFSHHPAVSHCIATSFLTSENAPSSIPSYPSQLSSLLSSHPVIDESDPNCRTPSGCLPPSSNGFSPTLAPFVPDAKARRYDLSSSVPSHFNFSKSPAGKTPPKSPLSTLKLFLKSPKQDKVKQKPEELKTPTFQNKKKAVSPVKNKKWYKQPFQKFGHRRTDSTDEVVLKSEIAKKEIPFERSLFFLTKDNTSSPRQRNRIRTNPWLPTEPLSTQNFHNIQLNFSPNLTRNRSCTNTPLQNRKTNDEVDTVQNRLKEISIRREDSRDFPNGPEKTVNRQKVVLPEPSDHSEEDLTLNEMMGTYNESYVYEKETDILSDSDPTDCEDYVSDSEADNGGDEQDSHDDELDFIDNGSIVEGGDNFLGNTGKCAYYDVYSKKNHFLSKSCRHHSRNEGDARKSFKKEADLKRKKSKDEKKKKSFRKSGKTQENKIPEKQAVEPVRVINMSKLLMHRANNRNGSKSADGTPVCLRRRKLVKELRETHIGDRKTETAAPENAPATLVNAVLEDDVEADKKYNELMLEAENIFVTMSNSPVIQTRKKLVDSNKERESLNIWRETESLCAAKCPDIAKKPETTPRRNLGLSLAVDPKKPNYGAKSSFKAKSSAHSPLDPLGPTFKNFAVFKEVSKKISSSSSDDSESNKPGMPERGTQNVVPIAFQSVDLGKPLTSYCPQSEPVKRKIYSCSKTYDQLLRRFENETKTTDGKGMRCSSNRCDSHRSAIPHQGATTNARRKENDVFVHENPPGNFFYNPVYSPYSSPSTNRKRGSRSNATSPGVRRRISYDTIR